MNPRTAKVPTCLHVWMSLTQLRQHSCQQVDALAVHQPAQSHHCDGLAAAPPITVAASGQAARLLSLLRRLLLLHVLWPVLLRLLLLSLLPLPLLRLRLLLLLLLLLLVLLCRLWLKQRRVHSCREQATAHQALFFGIHSAASCAASSMPRPNAAPSPQRVSPLGMTDTRPGGMQARSTVFSCSPAGRKGQGHTSWLLLQIGMATRSECLLGQQPQQPWRLFTPMPPAAAVQADPWHAPNNPSTHLGSVADANHMVHIRQRVLEHLQ